MGEYALVRVSSAGEIKVVVMGSSHRVELEALQHLAHCDCIEIVKTDSPIADLLVCDDSGKLDPDPKQMNKLATLFYRGRFEGDWIAGDVVFGCSTSPDPADEPDIFALPLEVAHRFAFQLDQYRRELGL